MIAETIKLLQSGQWYGCGKTIEIAKGQHGIPKTWKEAKEKIKRARYMHAAELRDEQDKQNNRFLSWLTRKK